MKYSLYKKVLPLYNDMCNKKVFLKNDNNVLFKSRNGYRHYYTIDIGDIKNDIPAYVTIYYALHSDINLKVLGFYSSDDIWYTHDICNKTDYKYVCIYEERTTGEKTIVRTIKINKFLLMFRKRILDIYFQSLLDLFIESYNSYHSNRITNLDNMLLVASTHPYDILHMSTDRRWISCTTLNNIDNFDDVIAQMKYYNQIIFYIVDKNDLNIKNPYYRLSLSNDWVNEYGMCDASIIEFIKEIYKKNYEI